MCRALGPPEVVAVEDVEPPRVGAGQVAGARRGRGGELPRRPARRRRVPDPGAAAVRARQRAGRRGGRGGGRRRPSVRVGDRVFGTTLVGAFAEEAVVAATSLTPSRPTASTPRWRPAFGVAHRTAYHVLRSVAGAAAGRGAHRPRRRRRRRAGGGAARRASSGATVTAVASSAGEARRRPACGATRTVDHRAGDLRQALKDALPDGADVVVDPVGGDLAEPALRALRWGGRFVTVGYASGVIPRIPLNLVLLKGVQILGFQFLDFATHLPDELAAQRGGAARPARGRAGVPAHRRPVPPRRHGGRPALRRRRPGDRQGRPRRPPGGGPTRRCVMRSDRTMAELLDLTGKVAIVTGGSRGHRAGDRPAAGRGGGRRRRGVPQAGRLRAAAAEIAASTGRRAAGIACHVGRWGDCEALVAETLDTFGRLDVLVSNAGMSPRVREPRRRHRGALRQDTGR